MVDPRRAWRSPFIPPSGRHRGSAMLIEKEVIGPGEYWYTEEGTNLPKKLTVTPELTKYWHQQGSAMLASGLTIPVPCEHDFNAHPMTPKEKLLNNAGWIQEYKLKPDNRLFALVDVQDEEVAKKLPKTIRYTSPWINSFTDGNGKQWNNVISHLALTTRPRITNQEPFGSIAAALSLATPTTTHTNNKGFCLSRAGRLLTSKKTGKHKPKYPLAFSLFAGAAFAADEDTGDDMPPKKKGAKPGETEPDGDEFVDTGMGDGDGDEGGGADPFEAMNSGAGDMGAGAGNTPPSGAGAGANPQDPNSGNIDLAPYGDPAGDVTMEELLCDLLGALGINCQKSGNDASFKRQLYIATMQKVKELTTAGQNVNQPQPGNLTKTPPQSPASQQNGNGQNPLIQQEQQPMFMSLEEINKLPDPMKSLALSMYGENQRMRAEIDSHAKATNSLRDRALAEAGVKRRGRVAILTQLAPSLKSELEAMLAAPSAALSMGDGGVVIDPMDQTLKMLEKGLGSLPKMLISDSAAFNVQPQPTDAEMSQEAVNELADNFARLMGCAPEPARQSA